MNEPIKVAIFYRVVQHWRLGIFKELGKRSELQIRLFYGEDFPGTKVVSGEVIDGIDVRRMKTLRLGFNTKNGPVHLPFHRGVYSQLVEFNPDVILCEGASNIFTNIQCFLYCKMRGVKFVQWGLGEIQGRRRSFSRVLADIIFRSVERYSDGAIAYSSLGASYYRKVGIPEQKVFVAVNVVDTATRRAKYLEYVNDNSLCITSPLPADFTVLYIGAVNSDKGIEILISAFELLVKDFPQAKLRIVGNGASLDLYKRNVSAKGIQSSVEFFGRVTQDVAPIFYSSSVTVLPGLGGLAISDSLCHGVPVICTIGDGCEKDLVNQDNGVYLDIMSVNSLLSVLSDLALDLKKLRSMRDNAYRIIEEEHNVTSYVDSIEECIFEVLGK